jgi:hypothetical protein
MSIICQLEHYGGSRDYARLAELARSHSIICIVTRDDLSDVAHTIYSSYSSTGHMWQVSARGMGYVWTDTVEDFVRQCERVNLRFIEPPEARIE